MTITLEADLRREFDAARPPISLNFSPESVLRQGSRTIRRRRIITGGSAALAVAVVATGASLMNRPQDTATPQPATSGLSTAKGACDGTALSLEVVDAEGYGTGQTAVLMTLRNSGPTACTLKGYPRLTALDDAGAVLPFTIHNGGSQSVTNQQPETVMIRPGDSAFVTLGKYRCDVGEKALVQEVKVILPHAATPIVLDLTTLGHRLAYCGPGDPGSELAVSPVEPTEAKTRNH